MSAEHPPSNQMSMLPNDKHPGPGCSCAECLRKFPDTAAAPASKDLFPCPFCLDDDVEVRESGERRIWIACNTCSSEGPLQGTLAEATKAWNVVHRATPPRPAPEPAADLNNLIDDLTKAAREVEAHRGAWEVERLDKARAALRAAYSPQPPDPALALLREIVHEYDQTHDGEIDDSGRARDWSAIPADMIDRARRLL